MGIFKRFSVTVFIVIAIEALLLLYFPPSLILEPNVTAGGDTPSHFLSAIALHSPSSFFSPVSWLYGNYAGFPIFLQYFPLPFMLMGLISLVTSLQVAFKLVTLLAILPLPAAVFYSLRRLGYNGATAALGAVFSFPFLVMMGNSMWGGNIASTLAGEFAFGISFILMIVYMGRMFSDAPARRSLVGNAFIEALIALGNGYPILQAGAGTGYFLIRGGSTLYILAMHALSFALISFWILPLMRYMPWNSAYAHSWIFQGPLEIAPFLLWPSIAGALIGLAFHGAKLARFFSRPAASLRAGSPINAEQYLWWQFAIALLGFVLAPRFGLVDVRFLPFAQIFIAMLGAIGWGKLISRLPRPNIWLLGFASIVIAFSAAKSGSIDAWVRWNYSGMESKPLWNSYAGVNSYLAGSENSPRAVYENTDINNGAGTARAFEMLPYYSGRSTLEGLYMQSSVSSPFAFYIQSEISETPSTPLPGYYYSRLDLRRAAEHLRLFNVAHMIAASDNICNALDDSPDFELQIAFPPYRVYRLKDAPDSYVTPLRYQPYRSANPDWKAAQFEWFRKSSLKAPIIYAPEGPHGDYFEKVQVLDGPPSDMPNIPIPGAENVRAEAILSDNRITVTTTAPGHPLWVKVSYHPAWRIARGDAELYLASPAFMLLVPRSPEVVLEFDTRGSVFLAGRVISLTALLVCAALLLVPRLRRLFRKTAGPDAADAGKSAPSAGSILPVNVRFIAAALIAAAIFSVLLFTRTGGDAQLLYTRAGQKYERLNAIRDDIASGTADAARVREVEKLTSEIISLVDESMSRFPDSFVFDHCFYFKARLLYEEKKYDQDREMIEGFLGSHPDTRILSECLLLLGDIQQEAGKTDEAGKLFRRAAFAWPNDGHALQAGARLAGIIGPDTVFTEADQLFEDGKYREAYSLFKSLGLQGNESIRDPALIRLAYCCFYMNRWEEASGLFLRWLGNNFDSPESPDAQYALRQCNALMEQNKAWQQGPSLDDIPLTPIGSLLKRLGLI